MDIYVARQPIFDRRQNVIGYELLYRSGLTNSCDETDGTEASRAVICNTFLGLRERIALPPNRVYIKLTRELLVNGVARTLPMGHTVIEIPGDIAPDQELVSVCQELKQAGYTLAFDDYIMHETLQSPLLDLADIVKVDFTKNSLEECRAIAIAQKLARSDRQLLAEKVETRGNFKAALDMGYMLFQGYFFSKPVIVKGQDVPHYKRNHMKILRELSRKELDFRGLEGVVKQDVSLCYLLLKYINSAYFGLSDKVTTILPAIVLLGETEVRRWASLVLLTLMGAGEPQEVVVRSLIRGRMCELLASDVGLAGHEPHLFLMGLFSMLDVLIGRPLGEILMELSVSGEVKRALLGAENDYRHLYDLVVSCESGEWEQCSQYASRLNLTIGRITSPFLRALEWADSTVKINGQN